MNVDMFFVMIPQLETMGLKYTLEVLWESGGQQKLNPDSVRKPPSLIDLNLETIV